MRSPGFSLGMLDDSRRRSTIEGVALPILIRPFRPADQQVVRRLILDGLGEHFGVVDEAINSDLDDIAAAYAEATLLVAELDGEIVGCGALIYEGDSIGRVVRMSVRKQLRRSGIATTILHALLDRARSSGYRQVVLETGFWRDSISFYKGQGFHETSRDAYGPNMALEL